MIHDTVLLVSAILMLVVVGVFVFVAMNASREPVDYPPVQAKAYAMRTIFFWVLVIAGVIFTTVTTLDLPYAATKGLSVDADTVINIEGRQWFWQLSQSSVKQGETVVFNVTAGDVNHGLGIYNEDMRLIAQTQAMPGYANQLKVIFDKPGTYQLLCMEYCGLAHHVMVSSLTVEPAGEK